MVPNFQIGRNGMEQGWNKNFDFYKVEPSYLGRTGPELACDVFKADDVSLLSKYSTFYS